jgi:hypothetical protein
MEVAPIALFVYNRPAHFKQTIEALQKNTLFKDSDLYIYCDGPKENAGEYMLANIKKVREIAASVGGCANKEIIISEANKGLARSIVDGVSYVVEKHGRIIVLEDDILTSPKFLEFMNKGLELYEREEKVISIHGYNLPISTEGLAETFFNKGADCWGWATWKRGWDLYESDAQKLLIEIERNNLSYEFDIEGSYPYTKMLRDQVNGKINSWAINWYASAFLKSKYTLYPSVSIVQNIGLDGSGTHCGSVDEQSTNTINMSDVSFRMDQKIENNVEVRSRWKEYYINQSESRSYGSPGIKEIIKRILYGSNSKGKKHII